MFRQTAIFAFKNVPLPVRCLIRILPFHVMKPDMYISGYIPSTIHSCYLNIELLPFRIQLPWLTPTLSQPGYLVIRYRDRFSAAERQGSLRQRDKRPRDSRKADMLAPPCGSPLTVFKMPRSQKSRRSQASMHPVCTRAFRAVYCVTPAVFLWGPAKLPDVGLIMSANLIRSLEPSFCTTTRDLRANASIKRSA